MGLRKNRSLQAMSAGIGRSSKDIVIFLTARMAIWFHTRIFVRPGCVWSDRINDPPNRRRLKQDPFRCHRSGLRDKVDGRGRDKHD